MPAILNSTTVFCNSTVSCTIEISSLQERLEHAQRLSYVLGALFALVSLLFLCGPLIFKRKQPQADSNHAKLADMPHSDRFTIAKDQESSQVGADAASTVTPLKTPNEYREAMIRGKKYHFRESDAFRLAETGIFSGLPNQWELAAKCVRAGGSSDSGADEASIDGSTGVDLTELKSTKSYRNEQSSERKLC